MSRVYVPFQDWPSQDHQAWATAMDDGVILEGRGPAHHWRPATRHTNTRHYARWLSFVQPLTGLKGHPAHRVTKANVQAYVKQLQSSIAPRTVVSSLVGLKVMMKAMAPEGNWRWLEDICNRLNRNSKPVKDKRIRILDSGEIYQTTLKYLDRLTKTGLNKRKQLVGFRNGLMVALMAARPLRRKNFADLTIGTTIRPIGDEWLIKIPGRETKNGQPLEFELPDSLIPYLETYFIRVRARIAKPTEPALWISWGGDKMAYHMVYIAFTRITKELFGKSINPHLFRDCAATTLASKSLKAVMAAPGLLGHKRLETTEKHYIHARQLEASRTMNGILAGLAKQRRSRMH